MNLLLASLRRVEVRIEPQSITDFLKWKNRMAEYNRGTLPEGLASAEEELNVFLEPDLSCSDRRRVSVRVRLEAGRAITTPCAPPSP